MFVGSVTLIGLIDTKCYRLMEVRYCLQLEEFTNGLAFLFCPLLHSDFFKESIQTSTSLQYVFIPPYIRMYIYNDSSVHGCHLNVDLLQAEAQADAGAVAGAGSGAASGSGSSICY